MDAKTLAAVSTSLAGAAAGSTIPGRVAGRRAAAAVAGTGSRVSSADAAARTGGSYPHRLVDAPTPAHLILVGVRGNSLKAFKVPDQPPPTQIDVVVTFFEMLR